MRRAIAKHLNVKESAIIRIEEWAYVLFVVIKGVGGRFVSKKVVAKDRQPKNNISGWPQPYADRPDVRRVNDRYPGGVLKVRGVAIE